MVVDNADDIEEWTNAGGVNHAIEEGPATTFPLLSSVPRGHHGKVLFTTRDSQLGKIFGRGKRPIEVLPLSPKEAEDLLRTKISEDDPVSGEEAAKLTRELDYLPLAITQAAAYLDQNERSVAEYLQLLKAGRAITSDLLTHSSHDSTRDPQISNSVYQTWKISFDQICRQHPRAAKILSLMATLDRTAVPHFLLRDIDESELNFVAAIQKVKAFSMIKEEQKGSVFSMHRLLQVSIIDWLKQSKTLSVWQEAAISAVYDNMPKEWDGYNWTTMENMQPHVTRVLDYPLDGHSNRTQLMRSSLLHSIATYSVACGRLDLAQQQILEALHLRSLYLPLKQLEVLKGLNTIISLLDL